MAKLTEIEGVGPAYAEKLATAGIGTTEKLLEAGAMPAGRKELAEKSGISEKQILSWVNMCDLFRIKGVGSEYAELLEATGVDTVPELAKRNVENLVAAMEEKNAEKNLVRATPPAGKVKEWIAQAKELPRIISY